MSDYTITTDFSPKDSLPDGDPEKIILGADLDVEYEAIATAIATKYDSGDIATQAQAEAGANNTTLMTPLRVQQALADNGGLLADIKALADPGADRILFWDDSDGAVEFLTVGAGLDLTGNTLTASAAAIDHDSLSGFVANEHVDHSAVAPLAGTGLSVAGSDITADFTYSLDIDGLTAEASVNTADTVAIYDASAGALRKATVANLVGAAVATVPSGRFYRSTTQALSGSTATTVVFNSTDYDALSKGSFSTATGVYTVGGSAVTVLVTAGIFVDTMPVDSSIIVRVEVNGTKVAEIDVLLQAGTGTEDRAGSLAVPLSLAAADEVEISVTASSGMNIGGSTSTYFGIVELS